VTGSWRSSFSVGTCRHSLAALNIGSTTGVKLVAEMLGMLGKAPLVRGRWMSGSDSRDAVFSYLIRVCFPGANDTLAMLAAASQQAGVPATWLVDLAVYAPRSAPLVEEALGWPGLTDSVL
jgi:hypothetical protein